MRIEDEAGQDATARRSDTIRQMQALMEQQDQLGRPDAADKRAEGGGAPSQPSDGVDGAASAAQLGESVDRASEQRRIKTEDLRARQDGLGTEERAQQLESERSGSELHAQAVSAASNQQDRGEAWMSFRDRDESVLPRSVEEVAQQEKQDAADQQQQREQISVQALMNQYKINNGIPG